MNRAPIYSSWDAPPIIKKMSNTTVIMMAMKTTTNASSSSTPAPTAPFCFTCGFDFGHVLNGVDDRTAGALMVVLFLMVLLAISVLVACLMHDWCCNTNGYRHLSQKNDGASGTASDGNNDNNNTADDNNKSV